MSTPTDALVANLRRCSMTLRRSRSLARMSTPLPSKTADIELDEAAERLEQLEAERDALVEALKPSADTKAAYIGEFSWTVNNLEDDGSIDPVTHIVPWTTVKEIMKAIHARANDRAAKARTAWAQHSDDPPSRS